MAFNFAEDGECIVCGQHTSKTCDSCRQFFCDEHRLDIKDNKSAEVFILCKECYEKGKAKRNTQSKNQSSHYNI